MKRRIFISLACLMTLLLPAVAPAVAQENRVTPEEVVAAAAPEQGPADPAELEAFLDDLLTRQLAEHHIAGAVVAVVKNGRLLLAKGYGYADVENGVVVDPEQTVFYMASVGKLFTWTAVMQLVEQGKLDLDADINTYLDFRIPDTYPQPITLKHLLTHTPGFEDRYFEYLALDADHLMPEREWLESHMPARVRPPGDAAAYSNYGTQLAGYIVARVSGQSYEQYIQEHILDPLGMVNSTAYSPVPAGLRAQMAVGYTYVDGAFRPAPDLIGQPAMAPAGSHASSAMDMARFMIAHLADGDSDANPAQGRILSQSTVRQMHGTLYAPDPRLRGTAYGLFDLSDNGRWTLGHDGDTLGFKSLLLLLPDENLGVFVSYNGEEADDLTRQHFGFQRAFFDHYYPVLAAEPIQPPADFTGRAGQFEGAYRTARGAYTTLEKYRNMAAAVEVSAPGDGTLLFQTPWGEWRYVEVEPFYFRQVDGPSAAVFRADDQGRVTHMFMDVAPQFAFEKMKWYELPGFNMGLVVVCSLLFLSVIPVAVIRFIRNRRPGGEPEPAPRSGRAADWIILGVCVLNLLFVAGAVLWGEANLTPLFGISPTFRMVLGLGVLSAALTAVALVYTALAWKDRRGRIAGRVYYTLVTAAAVAFVWFLNFWNLLGWRF
jgi:CubicO group peptidase (beta-lactamase class C family)